MTLKRQTNFLQCSTRYSVPLLARARRLLSLIGLGVGPMQPCSVPPGLQPAHVLRRTLFVILRLANPATNIHGKRLFSGIRAYQPHCGGRACGENGRALLRECTPQEKTKKKVSTRQFIRRLSLPVRPSPSGSRKNRSPPIDPLRVIFNPAREWEKGTSLTIHRVGELLIFLRSRGRA